MSALHTLSMIAFLVVAMGLSAAARVPGEALTTVSVHGVGRAQGDWVLEIGRSAFRIDRTTGGGVAGIHTDVSVAVRLLPVPSCEPVVTLTVRPGSAHVLRVGPDGSVNVEDWTGRGVDAGPAFAEAVPNPCAPASSANVAADWGALAAVGVAAIGVVALAVLLFLWPGRRPARWASVSRRRPSSPRGSTRSVGCRG